VLVYDELAFTLENSELSSVLTVVNTDDWRPCNY